MKNTIAITSNGQNVTIDGRFADATNFNRVKSIFIKTDGKTGTWTGHHSWLAEYLPHLQDKFLGNCVIVEAPQEIVEKYGLIVEETKPAAPASMMFAAAKTGIKRCAVCGSTYGLMNASTGVACPIHFDELS